MNPIGKPSYRLKHEQYTQHVQKAHELCKKRALGYYGKTGYIETVEIPDFYALAMESGDVLKKLPESQHGITHVLVKPNDPKKSTQPTPLTNWYSQQAAARRSDMRTSIIRGADNENTLGQKRSDTDDVFVKPSPKKPKTENNKKINEKNTDDDDVVFESFSQLVQYLIELIMRGEYNDCIDLCDERRDTQKDLGELSSKELVQLLYLRAMAYHKCGEYDKDDILAKVQEALDAFNFITTDELTYELNLMRDQLEGIKKSPLTVDESLPILNIEERTSDYFWQEIESAKLAPSQITDLPVIQNEEVDAPVAATDKNKPEYWLEHIKRAHQLKATVRLQEACTKVIDKFDLDKAEDVTTCYVLALANYYLADMDNAEKYKKNALDASTEGVRLSCETNNLKYFDGLVGIQKQLGRL